MFQYFCSSPKPISPSVSPLMRAAPDATSLICSTLWTRVPSRMAWYSQVFLRYRFRMWQSVESAVSSTAAEGILHTAIPADMLKYYATCKYEPLNIRTLYKPDSNGLRWSINADSQVTPDPIFSPFMDLTCIELYL